MTQTTKWKLEDLAVGKTAESTFWTNPVEGSPFRFRATHLDGRRAPKVVLSNDPRIVPGLPCLVKITAVRKPERSDRGSIEVEYISAAPFRLEGVYLDPKVAKKLQVLLESGLNILLDGPQGCGKTVLARSIAEALGMEFVFFNARLRRRGRGDRFLRHDPGAGLRVRRSGDRLRQDRRPARGRRSGEKPGPTLPRVSRRAQPLPGERSQRAHAGPRQHAPRLPSDREPLRRDPSQRPVRGRDQPRPRCSRPRSGSTPPSSTVSPRCGWTICRPRRK